MERERAPSLARIVGSLVGLLVGAAGAPALAFESPWTKAEQSSVRLVAAGPVAAGDARLRAGVEIRMTPGWHTYWRYPGDAGVPPRFDWTGSDNVAAVEVLWPAPRRIDAGGAMSIGYEDSVLFPLRVVPRDPKRAVQLVLRLDYAVCERICIPAQAGARLEVPAGGAKHVAALDAAEKRVPRRAKLGERGDLAILGVRLERGSAPRVLISVAAGAQADLFAEGPSDAWALPLPAPVGGAGDKRFVLPIEGAPPGAGPIPSSLRLTLVAGEQAIEVEAPLE